MSTDTPAAEVRAALQAVTVGPDDHVVLIWPGASQFDMNDAAAAIREQGLEGRLVVIAAEDVQAVAIRATKAQGSTVGECGDAHELGWHNHDTGLRSVSYISCWLADGHTGLHSDGTATWWAPRRVITGIDQAWRP